MNYYSENADDAAGALLSLIRGGEIPDGDVDGGDVRGVRPADLGGYSQCHFFAGIGGWPLALRLAGWPAGKPVWTGSCPCQPFSAAGKRKGEADDRHLWPVFGRLIGECRPAIVFGEQVASADGREWLARVRLDLEAMGYAVGAADLCAAGVGAPHIRQRLYFGAIRLADAYKLPQFEPQHEIRPEPRGKSRTDVGGRSGGIVSRLADADGARLARPARIGCDVGEGFAPAERNDFWSDAEWLDCGDGKTRRVKSGVRLLVDGVPSAVAPALSGFGNAIVPQVAAEFVRAFCDSVGVSNDR